MWLWLWLSFVAFAASECPTAGCGACLACINGACQPDPRPAGNPCGACQQCSNGKCVASAPGTQCPGGFCREGACVSGCADGCGTCRTCSSTTGTCLVDPTANNCPLCMKCSTDGSCVVNDQGTCPGGRCLNGKCVLDGCSPACNACESCSQNVCVTNNNAPATACGACMKCAARPQGATGASCVVDTAMIGQPCSGGVCNDVGVCENKCRTATGAVGCDICFSCQNGRCIPDDNQVPGDCQKCVSGQVQNLDGVVCPGGMCRTGGCVNTCPASGCGACHTCKSGVCAVAAPGTPGATGCDDCHSCDNQGNCVADATLSGTVCGPLGAGTCDAQGTCQGTTSQCGSGCPTCQLCSSGKCTAADTAGCPECFHCSQGACVANAVTAPATACSIGTCDAQGRCVPGCGTNGCGVCMRCNAGQCVSVDPTVNPCGPCQVCAAAGTPAFPGCVKAQDGTTCPDGKCANGQCVSACPCPRCLVCSAAGTCVADSNPGTTNVCPECNTCGIDGCVAAQDNTPCSVGICQTGKCVSNCGTSCGRCKVCDKGQCVPATNTLNQCPPCTTCGQDGTCVADTTQTTCPGGKCVNGKCQGCPTAGCPACQTCKDGACVKDVTAVDQCPGCSKCTDNGCAPDLTATVCANGVCKEGVCTSDCPAGGCPACKTCSGGSCVADASQNKRSCPEGVCKDGVCVSECPAAGCGSCQVCGNTGVCNLDQSTTARGCPACQSCSNGQCVVDDTLKCEGGVCTKGTCVPSCGATTCNECQSCANGNCANDDTQKCFGGTCQGGACKCGTGAACTGFNVCTDGTCVLACAQLIRDMVTKCACPVSLTDLRNTASCPDFCAQFAATDSGCAAAVTALGRCATDAGLGKLVEQAKNLINDQCNLNGAFQMTFSIASLVGFLLL